MSGLVRVAGRLGRAPGWSEYASIASGLGLASRWTLAQRFGGWRGALSAAGLVAGGPVRRRAVGWDEAACWRAVRSVKGELGDPPRYRRYVELAAGRDDLPSGPVVRRRLGLWSQVAAELNLGGGGELARRVEVASAARERLRARDREIVGLRLAGCSLRELADRFGVSPARVAQIVARDARPSQIDLARARRERAQHPSAHGAGEIVELWRAGLRVKQIHARTGVPWRAVRATVAELADGEDRDARAQALSHGRAVPVPAFSDEQLLAGVRAVAGRVGRPPTMGDYRRLRSGLRLAGTSTVYIRFGSWPGALRAAGLEPPPASRRVYRARWDARACWRALESVADQLGDTPRCEHYQQLADQRDDLPSATTVRRRLGLWSEIAAALGARNHGDHDLRRAEEAA